MADRVCPTETEEEEALNYYCEAHGYQHWHVPQETFTKSWKQKAKNKAQGVKPGVSDHWVVVPNTAFGTILFVFELKKQFGNTPSDDQLLFVKGLDRVVNVAPTVCYGADEAITIIEESLVGKLDMFDKCNERVDKLIASREIEIDYDKFVIKSRKIKQKRTKSNENDKNDLPY